METTQHKDQHVLTCGNGVHVPYIEVVQSQTPFNTDTHYPIPHATLFDIVVDTLSDMGWSIINHEHVLAREGMHYFALLRVCKSTVNGIYETVIGIRNAHDKAFAAGLIAGNLIMVCTNLDFYGEVKIGRKHTRYIMRDLGLLVSDAIERLSVAQTAQNERIEAYKIASLTNTRMHDACVWAMDNGVIPASKIPTVLSYWRGENDEWTTEHDYQYGFNTLWRAHNSFTSTLKTSNVFSLPAKTERLNTAFDRVAGLIN